MAVVAASIGATALFQLPALGIKTIGTIPSGLPSLVMPQVNLLEALWPAALAIALMSFTETIASGRAFARPGQNRPEANRELLATGVGNLLGGLVGAMPSGGGTSQTLVQSGGARTQLAGLVVGLTALAVLFLFAPAMSLMPQAVLAAIVVVYSWDLISLHELRAIAAVRRNEFIWSLVAVSGVVFLGTLRGILVAVVTSMVALVWQASNPAVYELVRKPGTVHFRRRSEEHPRDETIPGLLMVRVEGRLFFANSETVHEQLTRLVEAGSPRILVLDCSAIIDLEYSAVKMLMEAEKSTGRQGAELWLAGLNPTVRMMVERSPLGRQVGPERIFNTLGDVVDRHSARDAGG